MKKFTVNDFGDFDNKIDFEQAAEICYVFSRAVDLVIKESPSSDDLTVLSIMLTHFKKLKAKKLKECIKDGNEALIKKGIKP